MKRLQPLPRAGSSARPDSRPLVIIGKVKGALKLIGVDRIAAGLSLSPGLTLADARARVPDLIAADDDPAADSRLLAALAAFAERCTPLAALDPPQGLILDITGCAHLFGGEEAMAGGLQRKLGRLGFSARAAIAGTPDAARALAQYSPVPLIISRDDQALAGLLPAAALGIGAETALALARAGLRTIGDLASRPPQALASRFGEGLLTRLRRVTGHEDIRVTPLRRAPDCMAEKHFAEPVTQAEGLEAALALLIRDVCEALERRGAGGRVFEVVFFRADGAVRRVRAETGRPSRDARLIARLFRERLEALADPLDPGFGFDALRLAVPLAEPLDAVQPGFGEPAGEAEDIAGLIDRLAARLGRERVLCFAARDTHDPAMAEALVPAGQRTAAGLSWITPEPGEPPSRPLHLFAPPQPIETLAEVPDGPPLKFRWRRRLHEIARAEGPERIAPAWGRDGPPALTSDYYRIEDAEGRRFWVFRRGFYGEAPGHPRWFLHGLFA